MIHNLKFQAEITKQTNNQKEYITNLSTKKDSKTVLKTLKKQ